MKRVNHKKIKELIQARGEYGLANLSVSARISLSTLEKLMCGTYPWIPKLALQERLCRELNVPIEEIFVPVSAGKKSAS